MNDVNHNATQSVTIARDLLGYIIGAFGVVVAAIAVAVLKSSSASVELVQQSQTAYAVVQNEINAQLRHELQEVAAQSRYVSLQMQYEALKADVNNGQIIGRLNTLDAWEARRKQLEAQKK